VAFALLLGGALLYGAERAGSLAFLAALLSAGGPPGVIPTPAPPRLEVDPWYSVSAAADGPCRVTHPCRLVIALRTVGGRHVLDSYPTRFVVDADARTSELLGADRRGAHVFSKASDAVVADATSLTVAIAFRPIRLGRLDLVGRLHAMVCDAEQCRLVNETVVASVDVGAT
jgi:hypothetical protein